MSLVPTTCPTLTCCSISDARTDRSTEWIKTGHAAGEPASMQDRRDSALEVLAKAFALQPALKNRAREMISGQAKDDTDLNEMARDDPRFAKLIGLSA